VPAGVQVASNRRDRDLPIFNKNAVVGVPDNQTSFRIFVWNQFMTIGLNNYFCMPPVKNRGRDMTGIRRSRISGIDGHKCSASSLGIADTTVPVKCGLIWNTSMISRIFEALLGNCKAASSEISPSSEPGTGKG
jgi:hypothetical protein